MKINSEIIGKLTQKFTEDKEMLDMIYDVLWSFEEYHTKIIELELKRKMYRTGTLEPEELREMITTLDTRRTMLHNSVISGVNMLNRISEKEGFGSVYDGVVSEERPYRREVANAVLEYIQSIIDERI